MSRGKWFFISVNRKKQTIGNFLNSSVAGGRAVDPWAEITLGRSA